MVNKRKVAVDEANGVRIVKPRLDVQTKDADYLKPSRDLPNLDDKVSAFHHIDCLRNCPADLDVHDQVISAPFEYLALLPSKGIRDQAIDAFNVWVKAPVESLNGIKRIIDRLHNASLM